MKFSMHSLAAVLALPSVSASNFRKPGPLEDKVTPYLRMMQDQGDSSSGKTTLVCTIETEDIPPMPGTNSRFCVDTGVGLDDDAVGVLSNVPGSSEFLKYLKLYQAEGYTVGSITDLVVEAADASITGAPVQDGKSGDVAFPFGQIKPIVTAGERSVCDESRGQVIVGKPDGMGAYLKDDDTVRVLFQSESYGPLTENEAWAFPVNGGAALMGGSHINYIDYDRKMLKNFMDSSMPASSMVTGVGQHIKRAYNLRGEPLGRRNRTGETSVGAHLSNTNAAGLWVVEKLPRIEYDWFYQSLCSAHMEEAHQWGDSIGFEDDLFITNEEWHNFLPDETFVGNSVHVLDVATDTMWAVGSFSLGGFEKQAELNPQHPDYVMVGVAGYNGAYQGMDATLAARQAFYGENRTSDNMPWQLPENIHPYRFYLGIKGLMEDGSPAPESDFLARNGFRYGRIYGFAIDMSAEGPTAGVWRDEFHKNAPNGARVEGTWVAQDWRWNGTVTDFYHDGSWEFQLPVPGQPETMRWWNSKGYDESGAKTEHLSPDTRPGISGFIQGSTAGYFGHNYILNVPEILGSMGAGEFPDSFPGEYYVYQGENDVTGQIELGGKGQYKANATGHARDATCNYDNADAGCKETFEDIDGLEVICGADCCRVMIQEDSGNDLGERCFLSSCLEHEADDNELTYYFVAASGGVQNTRMMAGVGIPMTSNEAAGSHEFSGVFDLSGLLRMENDEFTFGVSDPGYIKRREEKKVLINDKDILINVQASNMNDRIMVQFGADTGGQVMIYKPRLP